MSVKQADRGNGSTLFNVIEHYNLLRSIIEDLCFRNFTHKFYKNEHKKEYLRKQVSKDVAALGITIETVGKEEYDKACIKRANEILDEFNYEDEIALELINREKGIVLSVLRELGTNILYGNNTYPHIYEEAVERRIYQDRAIACCYQIKSELQYIISNEHFRVDRDRIIKYDASIEDEIKLIQGWRKQNESYRKQLENLNKTELILPNIKYIKQTQIMMLELFTTIRRDYYINNLKSNENEDEDDMELEEMEKDFTKDIDDMINKIHTEWELIDKYYKQTVKELYEHKGKRKNKKDKTNRQSKDDKDDNKNNEDNKNNNSSKDIKDNKDNTDNINANNNNNNN